MGTSSKALIHRILYTNHFLLQTNQEFAKITALPNIFSQLEDPQLFFPRSCDGYQGRAN